MNSSYLDEAFKELSMLNEDAFDLNDDAEKNDLKSFLNNDESDFLNVVDGDAKDEDDLKDNYVGKVILECNVCRSMIYKNPDEVVMDEDDEAANVNEECPFCYSTDGFSIVGEVAPYCDHCDDESSDEDDTNESLLGTGTGAVGGGVVGGLLGGVPGAIAGGLLGGLGGHALTKDESLNESAECPKCHKTPCECTDEGLLDAAETVPSGDQGVPADNNKFGRVTNEAFENVSIETDTEKMSMTSDDAGKVVVTTEPKSEHNEILTPVSDELQDKINPVENEDSVEEFSEEEFDELGESYLRRVYENVNSFKTTKVSMPANRLVVEGVISFNSGATKKTQFVFENMHRTKSGKYRLIGENLQLSKGSKAFTLTGNLHEGKFVAESFNYNYRALNENKKSSRIYGTVRIHEAVEKQHPDLSGKETSISGQLLKKKSAIDNATSRDELYNILEKALADNNSEKAKQFLKTANSKKDHVKMLQYVYNFILKGDNLGSIERKTVERRKNK